MLVPPFLVFFSIFLCTVRLVHNAFLRTGSIWCTIVFVRRFVFVLCLCRRKQKNRWTHTDIHPHTQTDTQTEAETDRQTNGNSDRHADRHTDGHAQMNTHTDKVTHTWTQRRSLRAACICVCMCFWVFVCLFMCVCVYVGFTCMLYLWCVVLLSHPCFCVVVTKCVMTFFIVCHAFLTACTQHLPCGPSDMRFASNCQGETDSVPQMPFFDEHISCPKGCLNSYHEYTPTSMFNNSTVRGPGDARRKWNKREQGDSRSTQKEQHCMQHVKDLSKQKTQKNFRETAKT